MRCEVFRNFNLKKNFLLILLISFHFIFFKPDAFASDNEVNVYSYREPELIKPMLESFTAKTGIKVNYIFAKDGLIERMRAEGVNSPADVLLTNEFGLLILAKNSGVTASNISEDLTSKIPTSLHDPQGHWYALTRRARVFFVSKERVKEDSLSYEELSQPKWKGRICMRSGQHTYSVALIASMIAHHGREETEKWLIGLKSNLARKPSGGDREAIRDVYAGLCDLAIGNTYYMATMLNNPEQKSWAESVRILFPNAKERGSHVNISGMALAAHAPHQENAHKLMSFLASKEAQMLYAELNNEYPVVEGVKPSALVQSWGELKADSIPLEKIAKLRKEASELIDKVQFDSGPNS